VVVSVIFQARAGKIALNAAEDFNSKSRENRLMIQDKKGSINKLLS